MWILIFKEFDFSFYNNWQIRACIFKCKKVLYRRCIVNEYNNISLQNCDLWDCDMTVL
jgi:hypothetical protein